MRGKPVSGAIHASLSVYKPESPIMKTSLKIALLTPTLMLAACAPGPKYDTAQMSSIKVIAVPVPKGTHYYAGTVGATYGGGVIGIALAVAANVAANVEAKKHNTQTFNDVVEAQLGETGLSRKFTDALEAELKAQGYIVKEVDLSQDGMPKQEFDPQTRQIVLKGPAYKGADAILIWPISIGYSAPGQFSSFQRMVTGNIEIVKSDTLVPIFKQPVKFYLSPDSYMYPSYTGLVSDLPHAIAGLDDAAMSLVPQFSSALKTSRIGVLAMTGASSQTTEAATK